MPEELKQAAQAALDQLEFLNACYPHKTATDAADALRRALTQRPAAQTEREAFEGWARPNGYDLRRNDVLGHYSSIDTSRAWDGFRAGRASLPAPQQATPDLADGPARMHWMNWMPIKEALEHAYAKMGLEMVRTDAGAKYPNLHWNLAGLVREFVVAQQDAMFGKCQACGKSMGLLDQIKCLDCGTRLCEPCAKEHFGSGHGKRAAEAHGSIEPTTSGWVETSAPPQRLDWSGAQQATPEPVGEPFGYFRALPFGWEQCGEHDDGAVALYHRPAPGVPDGLEDQIMEALRDGLSVCMSVSVSRDRKISRDGCTLYAQTEEWCRWLDAEVGPKIRAAVDALAAAHAKGACHE